MEQTWFGISNKVLYSIIAVILLLWGLSGLQEMTKTPYDGYFTSADNIVTDVFAGSPAEAAGLKVGDQITKRDGISADNFAALEQLPRQVPGTKGTLTVQRSGTEQTLNITYGEVPTSNFLLGQGVGILMGLVCLLLGLFVYLRNPTERSSMLCLILFAIAANTLPSPYLSTITARRWMFALIALIAFSLLPLFLLYCLKFPRTKKFLADRSWLSGLIVAVPFLAGLFIAYLNLFMPTWSGGSRMILSSIIGLIVGGTLLLSLLAILHSYFTADDNERRAWGLNWMMLGVVIGLTPVVLTFLINIHFPRAGQMGWQRLIGLTFLAVPICFVLALMKREPVRHAIGEEARA